MDLDHDPDLDLSFLLVAPTAPSDGPERARRTWVRRRRRRALAAFAAVLLVVLAAAGLLIRADRHRGTKVVTTTSGTLAGVPAGWTLHSFRGLAFAAPADWPVYDMAAEPNRCWPGNVPGVYLGAPAGAPPCAGSLQVADTVWARPTVSDVPAARTAVEVGGIHGFRSADGLLAWFPDLNVELEFTGRVSTADRILATVRPASASSTSVPPTMAVGTAPLRSVDWTRVAYPLDCPNAQAPPVKLLEVAYAQPQSNVEMAVVIVACNAGAGTPPRVVEVYDRADSTTAPHLLQTVSDDRLPTHGYNQVTTSVSVAGPTITTSGATYSSSTIARCCPDGTFTAHWTWEGNSYLPTP